MTEQPQHAQQPPFDALARDAHPRSRSTAPSPPISKPPSPPFCACADEGPGGLPARVVEGGEHVGRYTFIGIEPYKTMTARGRTITIEEGRTRALVTGDIFEELKAALAGHTPARLPGLPPFTAGAVGFFAYDVVRLIEKLPALAADELGVPDALPDVLRPGPRLRPRQEGDPAHRTADLTRGDTYDSHLQRLDRLEHAC